MANPINENIPQYNILVLGTSGSGKTSFLASMYEILSVQRQEIGFFVRVRENEHKLLVQKYRMMEDPKRDWPPGTDSVSEWLFTSAIHRNMKTFELAKFVYMDYSGDDIVKPLPDIGKKDETEDNSSELIEDPNKEFVEESPTPIFSAYEAAEQANAILVLLDGLKIYHLMRGNPNITSKTLKDDLRYILPIVMNVLDKPLHFVITKWDILENDYDLDQIRDELFKDSRFSALVAQRRLNQTPTRLIPVSAVGSNFATLDTDEVNMIKNPQGDANPYQVEIPIACVLIDGFKVAQRNLTEDKKMKILQRINIAQKIFEKVTGTAKGAIPSIPLPPEYQFSAPILGMLLEVIQQGLNINHGFVETQIAGLKDRISTEEEALLSLIIRYALLMNNLQRTHPESDLLIQR